MKTQDKAIFLDRDGTIIIDKSYMYRIDQIEFFPFSIDALKIMDNKGYRLFMVSNQSGIGRGKFSDSHVIDFNNEIQKRLLENNFSGFTDMAYCPHAPEDNCLCRKPRPKLINDFISKYSIDRSSSYMIGDKIIDAECGENAGLTGVLLGQKSHKFKTALNILEFAKTL